MSDGVRPTAPPNGRRPAGLHRCGLRVGHDDRRRQLFALWDALAASGAAVVRLDLAALPADVVEGLHERELKRLRTLLVVRRERDLPPPKPPVESEGQRAQRASPRTQRANLRQLLVLVADVVYQAEGHTTDSTPVELDHEDELSAGRDKSVEDEPESAECEPEPAAPPATGEEATAQTSRTPVRRLPAWLDIARLERTVPEPGWRQQAACSGLDPNWFHPESGESKAKQRATCATCPVKYSCLAYDLVTVPAAQDHGIWGGTTERQRRAIRLALTERRDSGPRSAA